MRRIFFYAIGVTTAIGILSGLFLSQSVQELVVFLLICTWISYGVYLFGGSMATMSVLATILSALFGVVDSVSAAIVWAVLAFVAANMAINENFPLKQ